VLCKLIIFIYKSRREDSKERHPKCKPNVEERVYESCISSSFCGGEDEVVSDFISVIVPDENTSFAQYR
jgi:hypothetical protein